MLSGVWQCWLWRWLSSDRNDRLVGSRHEEQNDGDEEDGDGEGGAVEDNSSSGTINKQHKLLSIISVYVVNQMRGGWNQ